MTDDLHDAALIALALVGVFCVCASFGTDRITLLIVGEVLKLAAILGLLRDK